MRTRLGLFCSRYLWIERVAEFTSFIELVVVESGGLAQVAFIYISIIVLATVVIIMVGLMSLVGRRVAAVSFDKPWYTAASVPRGTLSRCR